MNVNDIHTGYETSTHQPLVKGVLDLYGIQNVLEIGIGTYSTPMFKDVNYLGIENDKYWINRMGKTLPDFEFIYHDIAPITRGTRIGKLTNVQKRDISNFYKEIMMRVDTTNSLLFVDGYASTRVLAINAIGHLFDTIIYHDCEPGTISYDYHLIEPIGYTKYYIKSPKSWACLLAREDKGEKELKVAVAPHIVSYLEGWTTCRLLYIEKGE